jgi:hypothetical protein
MADTEETPTPEPETAPMPESAPEPTPEPKAAQAPTPAPAGSTVNRNKYERDLYTKLQRCSRMYIFRAFCGAKSYVCAGDLRFDALTAPSALFIYTRA